MTSMGREQGKGESTPFVIETCSPEATELLGRQLGLLLASGDIVTLSGELGGGKTCFVRGIVSGAAPALLGMVASPTFAILNEYPGVPPLYHYDCYRLRGCDDAIELGLEDHLHGHGICLIEWPDRISALLPSDRIEIRFEYREETTRRIIIHPFGERALDLTNKLESNVNYPKNSLYTEKPSAIYK